MEIHLKKILKEKNMSVNELHKRTGISRTTLDPLSKADELPAKTRFETLIRISDSLNVPLNTLISFNESQENIYNIEILKSNDLIFNNYDGNDVVHQLYLKVTDNKNRIFLISIHVTAFLPETFLSNYKTQLDRLEELVNYRELSNEEEKILNKEFIEIKKYISHEAQMYKGIKKYESSSINVFELVNKESGARTLPKKYQELWKKSTPLNHVINDDNFLKTITTFISKYYSLDKQIFIADKLTSMRSLDFEIDKEYITDFLPINFFSENENIKKTAEVLYKKD